MNSENRLTHFRNGVFSFFLVFSFLIPGHIRGNYGISSDNPDLIVGVVVEKMRYDYISRLWNQFGSDGFKRLFSEGTSFNNARYDYLVNQSSAGYATIFTGSNPSAHGIIADYWYDRLRNNIQLVVFDQDVIAVGGSYSNGKRSPSGLLAATFSDELRLATDFRSRIYSVSLNDAAAVLSGGFSANAAWWFDEINGGWMSSSFYIDSLPSWVKAFNEIMLPDTYLERRWEPMLDNSSYFGIKNSKKNEPFNYDFRRMRGRGDDYGLLKLTPYGNTFTNDFALNLIVNEQLGKRSSTDMIIISFSATAGLDLQHGTFSTELQDTYLRLDQDIAHLLRFLDDYLGKSKVLLFMTSDQAVAYPASYNQSARIPGGTFSPAVAMSLLRSYLNVTYGHADWINTYNAGMVYLNHNLIEDNNIPLGDIQDKSSRFLDQFTGVAGTVTEDALRRNYYSGGIPAKIQAGFHPKRSGDIMLYLRQGWMERSFSGENLTLISYDQHVPLVFYGYNMISAKYSREVSIADIAPTLSLIMNIPIPPFATGKPIMELLK